MLQAGIDAIAPLLEQNLLPYAALLQYNVSIPCYRCMYSYLMCDYLGISTSQLVGTGPRNTGWRIWTIGDHSIALANQENPNSATVDLRLLE